MSSALLHPRLMDCRRIFLSNYAVNANIGIHDFEKAGAQRLLINVDLYAELARTTPARDHISEVLDYDFIRNTVQARIARGHINLQETLCDEIARALLQHQAVRAVRVSTQKPDVYPDCEAVGVEIFRFRDE